MENNNANETVEERIPLADLPIQNEQNAKININKIKNNETTPASNHKERGDQLRRALRYNFLSYSDKWKVTHEPQGKLIYQFVKAIFVIIQLYCIGIDITKSNNNVDIIKVKDLIFLMSKTAPFFGNICYRNWTDISSLTGNLRINLMNLKLWNRCLCTQEKKVCFGSLENS